MNKKPYLKMKIEELAKTKKFIEKCQKSHLVDFP